jgi:hypothetical protein
MRILIGIILATSLMAQDKAPEVPMELQRDIAMAALDATNKQTAAQAASDVLNAKIANAGKVCGADYQLKNDTKGFWCEKKPDPPKEPAK